MTGGLNQQMNEHNCINDIYKELDPNIIQLVTELSS